MPASQRRRRGGGGAGSGRGRQRRRARRPRLRKGLSGAASAAGLLPPRPPSSAPPRSPPLRPGPAHARRAPKLVVGHRTSWSTGLRGAAFCFGVRIPEDWKAREGGGRDSFTLKREIVGTSRVCGKRGRWVKNLRGNSGGPVFSHAWWWLEAPLCASRPHPWGYISVPLSDYQHPYFKPSRT